MQGFNMGRYVPPDLEGTKSSGNALHRRRAPGTLRPDGTQTVRFEMPFPIWCSSCPKPTIIGQGVRFNAHKSRAGNYYSTPIWQFRLSHADCGGEIVIQTDPKSTAYVVLSGAKKRDTGDDADVDQKPILTDQEREKLRSNAFANLEKTIADREQLIEANHRINGLLDASSRHWDDPYTQNQRLRKAFRAGRHQREKDTAAAEDLKDRMSFGYDLLPATDEDAKRAALVDFGASTKDNDDTTAGAGQKALAKPLFHSSTATGAPSSSKKKDGPKKGGVLKADREASARKESFVTEIMGNTRAAQDPFLQTGRDAEAKAPTRLPGVKRKRGPSEREVEPPPKVQAAPAGLVDYESD